MPPAVLWSARSIWRQGIDRGRRLRAPSGRAARGRGRGTRFRGPARRAAGGERCVYKELRHPRPLDELGSLVEFPSSLAARDPALADRVRSSSAWPTSVVVGPDPDLALGTVLPRAPAEFWVSHRDGARRLATLSYLANDPDRMAVAYGVMMPAPGAPERVAVVYALARLLEAWQGPLSGSLASGSLASGSWQLGPRSAWGSVGQERLVVARSSAGGVRAGSDGHLYAPARRGWGLNSSPPNLSPPSLSPPSLSPLRMAPMRASSPDNDQSDGYVLRRLTGTTRLFPRVATRQKPRTGTCSRWRSCGWLAPPISPSRAAKDRLAS